MTPRDVLNAPEKGDLCSTASNVVVLVLISCYKKWNNRAVFTGRQDQDSLNDGTLESLRRETIVRVLRETGGVLSGPRGAAARLGLKRTTLQSRMQKLGISREEYENQQRNEKEDEN
jgi:transcriptional regulator with GAF, ATPase, and Fis domain